jgi:hypothetical protein
LSQHVVCWLWMFVEASRTHAFAPHASYRARSDTTSLCALGKAQNKQAELARKLELAKIQQRELVSDHDANKQQQNDEMKRRMDQDRTEFAQLLAKNIPPVVQREKTFTKAESAPAMPIVKPKAKSKVVKRQKKADGLDEPCLESLSENLSLKQGDVAKRRHFETLVSVQTKQPLGPMNAAQLVPWVPPFHSTYMIVLADPRKQSPELRQVMQYLSSNTALDILSQVIVISADLPEETAA